MAPLAWLICAGLFALWIVGLAATATPWLTWLVFVAAILEGVEAVLVTMPEHKKPARLSPTRGT